MTKKSKLLLVLAVFTVLTLVAVSSIIAVVSSDGFKLWWLKAVAGSYVYSGEYGKALATIDEARELRDSPSLVMLKADVLYKSARIEDAEAYYSFLILHGYYRTPEIYVKRAQCYVELGNPAAAILDYGSAIEADPGNGEYYYRRGSLYYQNRDEYGIDEAQEDFRMACDMGEENACNELRRLMRDGE